MLCCFCLFLHLSQRWEESCKPCPAVFPSLPFPSSSVSLAVRNTLNKEGVQGFGSSHW